MDSWSTYVHCLSSTSLESVQFDSSKLQELSDLIGQGGSAETRQSNGISRFISQPPSRLAVDIHAMAASCTLHSGVMAIEAGKMDIARGIFNLVIQRHSQPVYSFYASRAHALLVQIELHASLQ